MPDNRTVAPEEKLRLVTPPLQLRRPQSSGSGLKVAGALVVVAVLLLWLLGGERNPTPMKLSPEEGAAAADHVEQLTNELAERTREAERAKKKMAGGEERTLSLSGVQFTMFVPARWDVADAARQKFVRRKGDSRNCQLTADKSYDTRGLIADVKDKEVDFEAQMMKELLGMAIPNDARIVVKGQLIHRSYSATSVNYTVKTRMKMIVGDRSVELSGVNSTFAAGVLMVRLQCVNMSGTDDEDNYMETMGRSLKLLTS